jgi:hypothetical protein
MTPLPDTLVSALQQQYAYSNQGVAAGALDLGDIDVALPWGDASTVDIELEDGFGGADRMLAVVNYTVPDGDSDRVAVDVDVDPDGGKAKLVTFLPQIKKPGLAPGLFGPDIKKPG